MIVVPFGGLDMIGLLNSVTKQDMIKCTIKILETNLELAWKTGSRQVVVIFDMDGFSLRQYTSRPGKIN